MLKTSSILETVIGLIKIYLKKKIEKLPTKKISTNQISILNATHRKAILLIKACSEHTAINTAQ